MHHKSNKDSKITTFISTDSDDYYAFKNNYDYVVRPPELAQDDSKAIDVINHAINQVKSTNTCISSTNLSI